MCSQVLTWAILMIKLPRDLKDQLQLLTKTLCQKGLIKKYFQTFHLTSVPRLPGPPVQLPPVPLLAIPPLTKRVHQFLRYLHQPMDPMEMQFLHRHLRLSLGPCHAKGRSRSAHLSSPGCFAVECTADGEQHAIVIQIRIILCGGARST